MDPDDDSVNPDAEPDLPLPGQPGCGRPPAVHLVHPAALPAGGQAAICSARGEVIYSVGAGIVGRGKRQLFIFVFHSFLSTLIY